MAASLQGKFSCGLCKRSCKHLFMTRLRIVCINKGLTMYIYRLMYTVCVSLFIFEFISMRIFFVKRRTTPDWWWLVMEYTSRDHNKLTFNEFSFLLSVFYWCYEHWLCLSHYCFLLLFGLACIVFFYWTFFWCNRTKKRFFKLWITK